MSREHYLRLCISVFCFFAARIFALTSAQCYASITFGRPLTDNWFECFHSSSTAPCRVASTNLLKVARCWQRNMLLMYSRSTELFFGDKSRIALCYLTLTVVRLMLRLLHLRRFLFSSTTRLRPALGFRMNKRVKLKQTASRNVLLRANKMGGCELQWSLEVFEQLNIQRHVGVWDRKVLAVIVHKVKHWQYENLRHNTARFQVHFRNHNVVIGHCVWPGRC